MMVYVARLPYLMLRLIKTEFSDCIAGIHPVIHVRMARAKPYEVWSTFHSMCHC